MTESLYVSLLPSNRSKVDFRRETQDWPKCADEMDDWTMKKYHNTSTPDFYLRPGTQKLSHAAFHYRLNCGFKFKGAVVPISKNPNCFLEVIDHNRRQIMIFATNEYELVAALPMLRSYSVPPCWVVSDKTGRIITLDVDSVNLDLICSLLQCTGSLTGGEGFTGVTGQALCLLNLQEFLAIKKRFKIPANAIKRAFGAWQDKLPKDCPMDTLRGLLTLWLRLGPVAKFRFKNLVQSLVLDTFKQASTDPFPETASHDDELVRQLCRRIDDIRRSLVDQVMDFVLEDLWENLKGRTSGWGTVQEISVRVGYRLAQEACWKYGMAHPFPGRTGSINELVDAVEAAFISFEYCEQSLIETHMALSQHPWGFHGFCIDCLKRSLEHGSKSTAEDGFWNGWVNSQSWSEGCTADHGYTVFIDSFLGPNDKLRALIIQKWSKVEFDMEKWRQSLTLLQTIEKVFCLRHCYPQEAYASEPEQKPFIEDFLEAFARKHHFSIDHVRALFTLEEKQLTWLSTSG